MFPKLFEDIRNGIPFEKAYEILQYDSRGIQFNLEIYQNYSKLARIYRPWTNKESYDAFWREIESRRKADPNYYHRIDHLNDI